MRVWSTVGCTEESDMDILSHSVSLWIPSSLQFPSRCLSHPSNHRQTHQERNHALGVHALASVKLVVANLANDLLSESGSVLFKDGDTFGVGGGELGLDCLHVVFEVGEVGLEVSESWKG